VRTNKGRAKTPRGHRPENRQLDARHQANAELKERAGGKPSRPIRAPLLTFGEKMPAAFGAGRVGAWAGGPTTIPGWSGQGREW
jgi:hypothetical protein